MQAKTYLMCPPEHFTVSYAINPWKTMAEPVDRAKATSQWRALHETYLSLGHQVRPIDPVPGLPVMVFAANGAAVIGGTVIGARFRYPERAGEGPAYLDWFRTNVCPVAFDGGGGPKCCTLELRPGRGHGDDLVTHP